MRGVPNRTELVRSVSEDLALPISTVDKAVTLFLAKIEEAIAEGDSVNIREFGRFVPRTRRATVRANPRTGRKMKIPRRHSVGFIPSVTLKGFLNE